MTAIVGACMPYSQQNLADSCGSYFVDLSGNSGFEVGRSVFELRVGASCTYRAWSSCGHPQVAWRVNDPKIVEDFDVAWAIMDGLQPSEELDRWNFDERTEFNGSFASNMTEEYVNIRSPKAKEVISNDQWKSCKGAVRNLWVTFTRVKDSDPQGTAREARQLQYYPSNGTKFADLDIIFSNYKGPSSNASLFKVVSLALAAGLAALAF